MVLPCPIAILTHDDIEHPVQPVLDAMARIARPWIR